MPVVYTTEVASSGDGRNGQARSADGILDLALTSPKEVGGSGTGTNPEQLFAAGYAACFHSALRMAARERGVALTEDVVTARVQLVRDDSGFRIDAEMRVLLPNLDAGTARDLADQAHQRCPYSKAISGNVDVRLTVES